MFVATILACVVNLGALDHCDAIDNTRGPYATQGECVERVNEMLETVPPYFLQAHRGLTEANTEYKPGPEACLAPELDGNDA